MLKESVSLSMINAESGTPLAVFALPATPAIDYKTDSVSLLPQPLLLLASISLPLTLSAATSSTESVKNAPKELILMQTDNVFLLILNVTPTTELTDSASAAILAMSSKMANASKQLIVMLLLLMQGARHGKEINVFNAHSDGFSTLCVSVSLSKIVAGHSTKKVTVFPATLDTL